MNLIIKLKIMKNIIGLKEFREDVQKIAEGVALGNAYVVVKRSRPLFQIGPIDEEEAWETVVDFTKIKKGGVPIEEVLSALRLRNKKHGQTSKSSR